MDYEIYNLFSTEIQTQKWTEKTYCHSNWGYSLDQLDTLGNWGATVGFYGKKERYPRGKP